MNTVTTCQRTDKPKDRAAAPAEGASRADHTLIIMVESGVVTDILPTGPIEAVVVDLDMLENEDTFEQRMRKSVLPLLPEGRITIEDMPSLITSIVREYRRPDRRKTPGPPDGERAA